MLLSALLLPVLMLGAACSAPGSTPAGGSGGAPVVTIGVVDASENYWNVYKDKAAAKGITVQFVNFTDYDQPNLGVSQSQLQLNQCVHLQYLANYNAKNNDTLVPIGATAVYPLPLYSVKHTSVDQIPPGGQIAIPDDPTNEARSLLVLQAAKLITLRGGGNSLSTTNDIDTAASKVTVLPVDAAQTPATLASADGAIVNGNYATVAKLGTDKRIFADDPNSDASKPYINVFVARAADKDNPTYRELVALYHDSDVEAAIRADLGEDTIFKNNDAADLQAETTRIEDDIRKTGR
jgi:D-methionine transport system substrate-binding protein